MNRHSRRHFLQGSLALAGVGLIAGCGVMPGSQQPKRVPRVGFLKQPPLDNVEDFRTGMRELGYVEGRDFQLDLHYVERVDELPARAADLVSLPVDVIVAPNTAAVEAARKATTTIPIIMVNVAYPVASGLITSLNRPGGNITGTTQLAPGVSGKRLQILREIAPGIARIGVLWDPNNLGSAEQWQETQEAAQTLGLKLLSLEIREPAEFEAALALATSGGADALFLPIAQVVMGQFLKIAQFAAAHRLPSMAFQREFPMVGGLMSYGASVPDLYRRAAYYVDKILNGSKAADLPVEQPTQYDFVVNLNTAEAMGLAVPESIVAQATELIR